jgi:hypothetical protein
MHEILLNIRIWLLRRKIRKLEDVLGDLRKSLRYGHSKALSDATYCQAYIDLTCYRKELEQLVYGD